MDSARASAAFSACCARIGAAISATAKSRAPNLLKFFMDSLLWIAPFGRIGPAASSTPSLTAKGRKRFAMPPCPLAQFMLRSRDRRVMKKRMRRAC